MFRVLLASLAACTGAISDANPERSRPPDPETCAICAGESRLPRLTRSEYERSIRDALGERAIAGFRADRLPPDGSVGPFASNAYFAVDDDGVEAYRTVAEAVGESAAPEMETLLGCGASPDEACVEAFVGRTGARLFRRPFGADELASYLALYRTGVAEGTAADGFRLLVTALLQSPSFLYRIEIGVPTVEPDARALTGFEIATRLSFFLWKTAPDQQLFDAAAAGELDNADGIAMHARRMLEDPRADVALVEFHDGWLGVGDVLSHSVDDARYPEFATLKADMLAETETFVLHVFRESDARLSTLLTAPYTFASPSLAAFYGVEGLTEASRIDLDPAIRAGVLTHASFLASHTHDATTAGVHRGKIIREEFLCQTMPNPPPIDTVIAPNPMLSSREQLEEKTSPDTCRACHVLMNPIGFTFEHFDAIGRYRTMDGEHAIDATGDVQLSDIAGPIDGAVELSQRLAASESVHRCLAQQWLRFALGRPSQDLDRRSLDQAFAAYDASGRDLRELIVAITTTDAFRYRRVPSP
jgi:hypothetical protein